MSRRPPSMFTPEARAGIIARLEVGVSFRDAASAAGIRPETARSWLTRGCREGSGAYASFASAVEAAREVARSRPEPMGEDELARVVSEMVRGGSVQAMKLYWQMIRAGGNEKPADPLEAVDELAERRKGL